MISFLGQVFNFIFSKFNKNVIVSRSLLYLKRDRKIDFNYFDYIRTSTLELLCYEIKNKNIKGNAAELGVYKGKFAKFINGHLSDRKLYLFDTFEGFDVADKSTELNNDFSTADQDFKDTSVENVLSIMPHKELCIVKKGYFPDTAEGIEDTFCLVSLDADLYEPILSGLKFFYPKLSPGGYILVHDFNNDLYKGARKAVEEFCTENNISYTPLPDSAGSCIIGKG